MEADRRADNSGTTITNQTRRKSSQKEKTQQGMYASLVHSFSKLEIKTFKIIPQGFLFLYKRIM